MPFKIEGKVALITGGASGIGFCCVKELLQNGAKGIAYIDTNSEKGETALAEITKEFGVHRCLFIQDDITDPERFDEAFQLTVKTFKQLDIVINNAGIFNENNWEKCVDVNLMSCIRGTKLALEKYLPQYKSDEGVILNVSSVFGLEGFYKCPVYSTTKHGVIGLSRSYGAKEHYISTNVKVTALCPGVTITPILQTTDSQRLQSNTQKHTRREIPQTPEHVAEEVVKIIRNCGSGSVWVVKDSKPAYEVKFCNSIYNEGMFPEKTINT